MSLEAREDGVGLRTYVLLAWREQEEALALRDARHEGLDFELGASADDGVEVHAEDACELAAGSNIGEVKSGVEMRGYLRGFCHNLGRLYHLQHHSRASAAVPEQPRDVSRDIAAIPLSQGRWGIPRCPVRHISLPQATDALRPTGGEAC